MMERSPDDRFADYRELRAAFENVHSFRYETSMESSRAPPRQGRSPSRAPAATRQTLHGLLAQTKSQWDHAGAKTRPAVDPALTRSRSTRRCKTRPEPLKVNGCVNTIRDLCQPRAEDPAALVEVMEKVPGYESGGPRAGRFHGQPGDG